MISEKQLATLEKDSKAQAQKMKTLQEFFDKHDKILQEQQSSSTAEIIQLRKEKDDMEAQYKKELDVKTTALETLEGEFQVKMMKIRLMELEWENKLTDNAESQEQKEMEMSELARDNKKLKIENTKQKGNIRGLQKQKEELQSMIKQMENAGGESANEEQDQDDVTNEEGY